MASWTGDGIADRLFPRFPRHIPGQRSPNRMIKVQIRQNESLEAALRRFKRQCNQSGLFLMMKENAHFEKPAEERRRLSIERSRVVKRAERMRRIQRY